jgi:hypothetical protein
MSTFPQRRAPVLFAALLVPLVGALIAIGAGVAYIPSVDLSLSGVVDHPLPGAFATGIAGLAIASMWLYSMVRSPPDTLPRRGLLLGYFGLFTLGLFSLLMLKYFQEHNYPIAQYEVLPTTAMISHLILWDLIAGGALAYGLWLGSTLIHRRATRPDKPTLARPVFDLSNSAPTLMRWGVRLFVVGIASSTIVVGATHSLALLDPNIDAVRYTQGAGIGFATLGQYELITSGVLGLFLFINYPNNRRVTLALGFASIFALVLTRAERTPTLVIIFAVLVFSRLIGKRPKALPIFVAAFLVLAAVLFLGVYRLESQGGATSSKKAQVRSLLDISPEVREQAFVFKLFPPQADYLGTKGVLPIALAIVPGKLLAVAGVDKQSLNQDSSRVYTATMNSLLIYATTKPIRVGLAGELWMDAGPLGLIIGMVLYGAIGAWLTTWRPTTPLRLLARALAITFLILGLITPLAIVSPIAFVTLLPLMLARDGSRRASVATKASIP